VAKGQKRSTREQKKPKGDKKKPTGSASPFSAVAPKKKPKSA
jgi:hypothetical protein